MTDPAGWQSEAAAAPAESCAACGAALESDQEWCLECGAARTTLQAPPDWRIAVAIVAVVVILVVVVLVIALP